MSNQHVLTTSFPDLVSSIVGSYMIFYSLGSALGAAAITALCATDGWGGSSVLGAVLGACGLAVWAIDRRARARPVARHAATVGHGR